jgi:hypothetical protein
MCIHAHDRAGRVVDAEDIRTTGGGEAFEWESDTRVQT